MELKLLQVYTLLSLAVVAFVGSDALSPEMYWKSVLPNTPMPKAIKDLLYTKAWDDGKEKVSTETTTSMYIKQQDEAQQSYSYVPSKYELTEHPLQGYPFWFFGTKIELKDNPIIKLLFLEKDLHQGEELKLHFMKNNQKPLFLPKNISDSIPFSLKELPEIYNMFSVKPSSKEAQEIEGSLMLCEHKVIEGMELFCATSLESMIDFTTRNLGKTVKAFSTEEDTEENTPSQKYKIGSVKKLVAKNTVNCHSANYAYAVFFCHTSADTQSYFVSLEGADGTKMKSVAVCHMDTSKMDPNHLAFELLKVAPGTVPVCHFLPVGHVLWVPDY